MQALSTRATRLAANRDPRAPHQHVGSSRIPSARPVITKQPSRLLVQPAKDSSNPFPGYPSTVYPEGDEVHLPDNHYDQVRQQIC